MSKAHRPSAGPGTWRLGRVRGIELLIRPSLLLMAVVLIFLFAPRFDNGSGDNPYVPATLFVLALYVSVLVHEIAHVLVARHYRMAVASITLHLLGGETAIEGESRSPAQEFWTSFVGPVTSLAIGAAAWLIALYVGHGDGRNIVNAVAAVNVLVAIFNMVPGLPLDGGRVFRAIIWAVTGNEATGTKAAAWLGRVFAAAALIIPLLLLIRHRDSTSIADLVVGILVASFLWVGASDSLRAADRNARLNTLHARDLGEPGVLAPAGSPSLSVDLSGIALLRAMAETPSQAYRLTETDGTTYGRLLADNVDGAYRASRRSGSKRGPDE